MAIIADRDTKVIVQGMTGKEGSFHSEKMLAYGTRIVAGVTPGRGGEEVLGVPVYDTVGWALEDHPADISVIFVPRRLAGDAAAEAMAAGLKKVVVLTEGIPIHNVLHMKSLARHFGVLMIGPNTTGVVTVDRCKLGLLDTNYVKRGNIGVISRSGTLTTEIISYMVEAGFGQSTVVGIGGDQVVGASFKDIIRLFQHDEETEAVVMIGEIGGSLEEEAALAIKEEGFTKPMAAFIAGRNVPPGKTLGHAGAIIEGNAGTAEGKIDALEKAGVAVARVPWEIGTLLKTLL